MRSNTVEAIRLFGVSGRSTLPRQDNSAFGRSDVMINQRTVNEFAALNR